MANPTIGATTPRIQYTATASQTVFTVPFEFLANADLAVYVNGTLKTLTTDYTLTGANTTGGGSLTFVTGRTAGEIVTILGNLAYSRDTNKYTKYGLLPAEVLEADFDAVQVQAKQLALADQFALRLPMTDSGSAPAVLPAKTARANTLLGFDANGATTLILSAANDVSTAISAAQAAQAAAEAAQALAETAKVAAQLAETNAETAEVGAETAQVAAEIAEANAETARDAAFVNANVYANTAAGLAAVALNEQFQVVSGEEIIRYREDAGPVATEVARYPSASRVTDIKTDVELLKLGFGNSDYYTPAGILENIGDAALGSIGISPSATDATTHAAVLTQAAVISSVTIRSGGAMVGGIHAFENVGGVITCVAVWPFTTPSAGTHVFDAGAGVIPLNFVLGVNGFLAIKQSSLTGTGLLYSSASPADFVAVSPASGVGAVVTRATATAYTTSWSYSTSDVANTVANLETRVDGLEQLLPVNNMVMLYPPNGVLPVGWYDSGNTLLGMRMLSRDSQVFSGGVKGATVLLNSFAYQDAAKTTLADNDGELVSFINDQSPNNSLVNAPADVSRPTLRISGPTKYFEFDGVNDRLQIPAAQMNVSAMTFVCSVMFTGAGNIPQVLGDSSTSVGAFLGVLSVGSPLRIALTGGTISAGTAVTGGSNLLINTRYTLSMVYDGATLKGYVNGVEVINVARTGSFAVVQPLLCYSGANVVAFQGRLYGAVLVGKAVTNDERKSLEAAVASDSGILLADTSAVTTALTNLEQNAAAAAIKSTLAIAIQQAGVYYNLVNPTTTTVYALGDSTVAAYAGGTALLTLYSSVRVKNSLAVPGHTIAQQKTVWQATSVNPSLTAYVIVQIGLNDLDPAEAASVTIARLQDLINTIRTTVGSSVPIFISKMIPCRQRLINVYGAINGQVSQQKWMDMNDAIAGLGSTPITNVQGRITSHVPLMDDNSGNLLPAYDTGDGIHPNTAGRQVNATAWEELINSTGLTK